MIYPDLGFVLSVLVRGDDTNQSSTILRQIPHPLPLSLLHRVQIENGLVRIIHQSDEESANVARDAQLPWQHYLKEEVFLIRPFDLEAGFVMAATWNASSISRPCHWSLALLAALAATVEATFLSLQPTLRKLARDSGLSLLPERI